MSASRKLNQYELNWNQPSLAGKKISGNNCVRFPTTGTSMDVVSAFTKTIEPLWSIFPIWTTALILRWFVLWLLFTICLLYMLLTGLQMRTASSPVINKAQSKPRLLQGKTPQHRNTGFLGFILVLHTIVLKKNEGLWAENCWGGLQSHCWYNPKMNQLHYKLHIFNLFKQKM